MATTQAVKQKEKPAFFNPNITTEEQSLLFMKRVFASCLSTIVYMRGILPEESFKDTFFEGIHLKLLQQIDDRGSMKVIQWVKGCFDAMEKKYLSMVILGVCTDPNDLTTLVESYTFSFSYNNSGTGSMNIFRNGNKISEASSAAELTKATSRLMRVLVQMIEYLGDLPNDVYLTMKLHYYDDVTPADYQPPGFKHADPNGFHLKEYTKKQKLGEIATPYHTMSVRARVMMKYWEESDEETGQSQPVHIANYGLDNESIDGQSQASKMETSPNTGSGVPLEGDAKQNGDNPSLAPGSQPAVNKRGASNGHVSASSPLETRCGSAVGKGRVCSTQDVCCPCGLQQVYGLMIMCCICGHWQHGVCFKVFDEESLSAHVCHVCAKASSDNKPTDPSLCGLSASASRNTCLWRRALLLAYELAEFEPWEFSETLGVDSCLTNRLLKRLEKEQFVSIDDKSDRQIKLVVDKRKLTAEGFPKYLESTTLRIVMETPEEQRENNEVATVVKGTPMMENLVRKTGGMNITQKSLKDVSNLNESQPDSTSESVMKRPKAAPKRRGKRKELDAEVMSSQDSVQVSKRQKASIAKTPLNFNV